jgi:hypothetical protein
MRRLQELRAVPSPTQEVAAPSPNASIENDPAAQEARLTLGFSAPCIGETKAHFH